MKHIVMISKSDYEEVISALRRLRMAANALDVTYLSGEIDAQLERIEYVFSKEEQT